MTNQFVGLFSKFKCQDFADASKDASSREFLKSLHKAWKGVEKGLPEKAKDVTDISVYTKAMSELGDFVVGASKMNWDKPAATEMCVVTDMLKEFDSSHYRQSKKLLEAANEGVKKLCKDASTDAILDVMEKRLSAMEKLDSMASDKNWDGLKVFIRDISPFNDMTMDKSETKDRAEFIEECTDASFGMMVASMEPVHTEL